MVDLKGRFEFAENSFDLSLCLGTLTYMDPDAWRVMAVGDSMAQADMTLGELVRVTKPGGHVIFSMRSSRFKIKMDDDRCFKDVFRSKMKGNGQFR